MLLFNLHRNLFHFGGSQMIKLIFLVGVFALPVVAQNGPCSEQFVKKANSADDNSLLAKDMYFFSGALEKPVVGIAAADKAFAPIAASRQNEKRDPQKADRIVVASSGDMAYEYGTAHMSFDSKKEGKHIDFTAAYLRVWKAVDGKCKIAAEMFEPENQ
jgi:ketosteroid isomerase-like protein